jgi:hypothetical protein
MCEREKLRSAKKERKKLRSAKKECKKLRSAGAQMQMREFKVKKERERASAKSFPQERESQSTKP